MTRALWKLPLSLIAVGTPPVAFLVASFFFGGRDGGAIVSGFRLWALETLPILALLFACFYLQWLVAREARSAWVRGVSALGAIALVLMAGNRAGRTAGNLALSYKIQNWLAANCTERAYESCRQAIRKNQDAFHSLPAELQKRLFDAALEPRKSGGAIQFRPAFGRQFEDLPATEKAIVRDRYERLLAAYKASRFRDVVNEAKEILAVLGDYRDTASFEMLALRELGEENERMRTRRTISEAKQAASSGYRASLLRDCHERGEREACVAAGLTHWQLGQRRQSALDFERGCALGQNRACAYATADFGAKSAFPVPTPKR